MSSARGQGLRDKKVFVCPVLDLNFACLHLARLFLTCRYILRISRSSGRGRGREQKSISCTLFAGALTSIERQSLL